MTKQTDFFTQLAPLIGNTPVDIRITLGKSGVMVCDFLPGGRNDDNNLKPLRLEGTPSELNEGFISNVEEAMRIIETTPGLKTSIAEFGQTEDEDEAKESKGKTKPKGKKADSKDVQQGKVALEATKDDDETTLRKKYTKSGTKVLEEKLSKAGLPELDKKMINEILANRTDRTPATPQHPKELLAEITRKVNAIRDDAQDIIDARTTRLAKTTDIERISIIQGEIDEHTKIVGNCDLCLKRITEGNYGITTDNTLIAKEDLLNFPLNY